MKTYNAIGYSLIILHVAASALTSPAEWGVFFGAAFGFAYLLFVWFIGGVYLSDVMHLGIAHRALDYKEWFIKAVTIFNNIAGIYINPHTWVNRHRNHHAHSDHTGDPNKLHEDGFWKTMYLCVMPYKCSSDLARDAIFKSLAFRVISNPLFALLSQFTSYGLLYLIVRDWKYALTLWIGVRVFALWINMIQNFWSHDRRFGSRRYEDEHDNAMNISEWLPVTASFSASLQNNHHHHSRFLRLSHDAKEYDFGFLTVRGMKTIGLVKASQSGANIPEGIPLKESGF